MTNSIGFVGLGIMGLGMVKNLSTKLAMDLVVWNRLVNNVVVVSIAFII